MSLTSVYSWGQFGALQLCSWRNTPNPHFLCFSFLSQKMHKNAKITWPPHFIWPLSCCLLCCCRDVISTRKYLLRIVTKICTPHIWGSFFYCMVVMYVQCVGLNVKDFWSFWCTTWYIWCKLQKVPTLYFPPNLGSQDRMGFILRIIW